MQRGVRFIKGQEYLLAGRVTDRDKAKDQAKALEQRWYQVRVIRRNDFDFMLYVHGERPFYDFAKNNCDRCGISKEEAKKFPVDTGINHPGYRYSISFYLDNKGGALCARCHREQEIAWAIAAIDRREKQQST